MKIIDKQFIVMLRDKFADQRILDKDGYLVGSVCLAEMHQSKEDASEVISQLDEPYDFEVMEVNITYEY